jgi:4-amino-4-deoxy-L-arabinose transferase-like glycosyltransferase
LEKEIVFEIKNPWMITLLVILFTFFILELQVMYSTQINFGDEGFHARAAQLIAEKVEYFIWRPFGIGMVKRGWHGAPIWHFTAAFFFLISKNIDIAAKFLPPFITFVTALGIFVLTKRIFNEKIGFLASIIFISFPAIVTYSVLFYKDALFVSYLAFFFLTILLYFKTHEKKYWLLAGVFSFLAFLTKTPGVVVYIFIILLFLYELFVKRENILILVKKYSVFIFFLIILPSAFFLRNLYYYNAPICYLPIPFWDRSGCSIYLFKSEYEFSGRTEQTGTEVDLFKFGVANYLEFTYGPLWFTSLAFLCGLYLVLSGRTKERLILLLILLTLIPVFYKSTKRTEDTARYTLGWSPIIALIGAIWLDSVYEFLKKYYKHFGMIVIIFVLLMSWNNLKGKLDIMTQVKKFSPLYFEACDWVKENLPENTTLLTIWVNRAVYNCQRNSVGNLADIALSRDIDHILNVAKKSNITHLFIQKFSIDTQNRHLSEKYDLDFIQFLENHPETFKKIYENGLPLQQCLQQGGCDGNIIYEIKF